MGFAGAILTRETAGISSLAFAGPILVLQAYMVVVPADCAVELIDDSTEVHMMLRGMIDFSKEVEKLNKQKDRVQQQMEGLLKRMNESDYEQKVPEKIREMNQQNLEKQKGEIALLEESISKLSKLVAST